MQIEGLTFLQAVEALNESRCEGIENEKGQQFWFTHQGILSFRGRNLKSQAKGFKDGVHLTSEAYLGEWRLVGVLSQTELKIITYWVVVGQDESVSFWKYFPPLEIYETAKCVEEKKLEYESIVKGGNEA